MHHVFVRSDGQTLRVDTDLWLCALDLAAVSGWKPLGTVARPARETAKGDRFAYYRADGRQVAPRDAIELAQCLNVALERVSDSVVPLRGQTFGEEHTFGLLAQAATGDAPPPEKAIAAAELLSGSPKQDARALIDFLRGGAVSIRSAESGAS